jgi:hypothetical protein
MRLGVPLVQGCRDFGQDQRVDALDAFDRKGRGPWQKGLDEGQGSYRRMHRFTSPPPDPNLGEGASRLGRAWVGHVRSHYER